MKNWRGRVAEEPIFCLPQPAAAVLAWPQAPAADANAAPLLGAVPELDSMAVVSVITTLEERFGFTINDDELDAASFASIGALTDFVEAKLAA